ncbi:Flp pilus assembly complex ATPase component TadA [Candidatus Uhrbacteria bacterium]|nr:Flp pilus assembly complex ATPase component TadA [Candidatus Uhrbacteria bacterium]
MNDILTFADLLLAKQMATKEQITALEELAREHETSLEEELVTGKIMTEDQIANLKAEHAKLTVKDLADVAFDQQMVETIPQDVAEHYKVISFGVEGNTLLVGVEDPLDYQAMEAVEFLAKERRQPVTFFVITRTNFLNALKKYRMLGKEVTSVVKEAEQQMTAPEKALSEEEKKMEEVIRSAPVSKIANMILRFAVDNKASDIHIEPLDETKTRVRYRIDGDLRTSLSLPGNLHPALVSRFKVMANLKIDENRVPQDGRIRFEGGGTIVDLRVSTLPLQGREKIVMRVLDTTKGAPQLAKLGFRPMYVQIMQRNIDKPHGMFLITGPTGSGKSTTLYAALNSVNAEDINIVTLEDPVEYRLPGINQSQVNSEVGFTFASGLRSILRQDPDVIMVGEIRDGETASLAVQAGLTGHLVFSTLHTNDAFGAIPRLIDMDVQPFLLVSTLNLVMAQRLVRTLCEKCKEPTELPQNMVDEITKVLKGVPEAILKDQFPDGNVVIKANKAKGCARCGNTGYKGRTTVAEFIEMTPQLQKIVTEGNDPGKVRDEINRQGQSNMREDGILKVAAGITTMEEVIAATSGLAEE